jgi:nucleotide-binding universal stress UspA family protein
MTFPCARHGLPVLPESRGRSVRGPLVVGVDGSDASLFGLQEAASMAQATRAALIIVFVRTPPYQTWTALTSGGMCAMTIADATQIIVEAECIAVLGSAGLNWQLEIRCGEPAGALMAVAKEYKSDTIVVSGRRHRAVGSIAHGAIATKLLHRWSGTLVVLHPPAAGELGQSINLQTQG